MSKEIDMIYTMRELLDFAPKDIRDSATYTWEELDQIFSYENIEEIKQSLQPNKEQLRDEIISELKKHYNCKVYYTKDKYKNGFHNGNVYIVMYEDNQVKLTTKYFNAKLPPKIMKMIGQYFELESDNNE